MLIRKLLLIACGVSAAAGAMPASADAATVVFSGARRNVTPVGGPAAARCGADRTVTIAPGAIESTGTSNLGAFTSTQSHCIAGMPPRPFDRGEFTYSFSDGATLFGTYDGEITGGPAGLAVLENLTVNGGTGRFLNATGLLTLNGALQFGSIGGVNVSIQEGTISGRLNAPGVPEPASWALMIAGFALIGGAARRGSPRAKLV